MKYFNFETAFQYYITSGQIDSYRKAVANELTQNVIGQSFS